MGDPPDVEMHPPGAHVNTHPSGATQFARVWCESMSGVAGEELEFKLELTPQEMQRIGDHPALEPLTVGRPETSTLRSIYFDTPDHRLRALGISLRLRSSDGGQWVQTVKAGNWVIDGIFDRKEFETSIATPQPNLAAISDRKVRRKIEHAVRTSSLGPLFETVVNARRACCIRRRVIWSLPSMKVLLEPAKKRTSSVKPNWS